MAYSSTSSMQDLFYMDNAPVASTSTCSTPETRFTVDYAPRPSPIHHWLAAHRPYLPHDEPASCSTPRSAFSDDEDESEESEQEQDESEDESEEEDEREMIFLRPRRHGSASPFARSSSDLVSPRKLRSNPVLPTTVAAAAAAAAPAKKAKQSNSPRMIAALASYRPRPAQPIVDRVQASGTSSFEAAPCTSHWSSDEDECSEDYERRPRGRPYRRTTLRPDQDDEALWTVAPNELALEDDDEEDDEEEMPGLCEGSSTRSLPIPISPSPLRHPYFDPSRDDVSIVLSTTEQQPISPAHDAKATRQLFQKGQSFYNGWLREYVAAHH